MRTVSQRFLLAVSLLSVVVVLGAIVGHRAVQKSVQGTKGERGLALDSNSAPSLQNLSGKPGVSGITQDVAEALATQRAGISLQPTHSALELVQAGKEVRWGTDHILHVGRRTGTFIEGVQLLKTTDGKQTTLTAENGTLAAGADRYSIKLTLYNVQIQNSNSVARAEEMTIDLTR